MEIYEGREKYLLRVLVSVSVTERRGRARNLFDFCQRQGSDVCPVRPIYQTTRFHVTKEDNLHNHRHFNSNFVLRCDYHCYCNHNFKIMICMQVDYAWTVV